MQEEHNEQEQTLNTETKNRENDAIEVFHELTCLLLQSYIAFMLLFFGNVPQSWLKKKQKKNMPNMADSCWIKMSVAVGNDN